MDKAGKDPSLMSLDDLIELLEGIPGERWGETDISGPSQPCLVGLLDVSSNSSHDESPLVARLLEVSGDIDFLDYWQLLNKTKPVSGLQAYRSTPRVVRVNRGEDVGYRQEHPKDRVLSYLNDVRQAIQQKCI